MTKITRGNIPTSIVYICKPSEAIAFVWDGDDTPSNLLENRSVRPAFISDADNKKTIETGVHWATPWRHAHQDSRVHEVAQYTFDNLPARSVELISLEKRSQGGRAYKVIVTTQDNQQFFVDLREDVLLETARTTGITKGGFLNGEFIWARVGSDMKLIRVGSELHERMMKTTQGGKKSKIKEYEYGGVYETKTGQRWIYCGVVDTFVAKDLTHSYGYSSSYTKANVTEQKGVNLWIPVKYKYENTIDWYKTYCYYFEFGGKKAVINKVDQLTLPDNFFSELRKFANEKGSQGKEGDARTFSYLTSFCAVANMRSETEKDPIAVSRHYKRFLELHLPWKD